MSESSSSPEIGRATPWGPADQAANGNAAILTLPPEEVELIRAAIVHLLRITGLAWPTSEADVRSLEPMLRARSDVVSLAGRVRAVVFADRMYLSQRHLARGSPRDALELRAHALGHLILHTSAGYHFCFAGEAPPKPRAEAQADVFAALLLGRWSDARRRDDPALAAEER